MTEVRGGREPWELRESPARLLPESNFLQVRV
jgi:hypothetical protein